MKPLLGATLEEKLLLNSAVNENGCRIWQRSKMHNGYGRIKYDGKTRCVSRIAFEHWVEPLRDGMFVCHTCDVRACIEPTHLFQDTHQANMADRNNKGRQANGEIHGKSVFCDYDILEMRALYAAGFGQSELGRMYDVRPSTIELIVKRKTWKHIPPQE